MSAGNNASGATVAGSGGSPPSPGGASGGGSGGTAGRGGTAGADSLGGSAGTGGSGGVPSGSGTITYERWDEIKGETIDRVPTDTPPDVTQQVPRFQAPSDVGIDYAARLRGFLTAPASGIYTFWISSDDNSALYLSSDENPANKQRIAHVTGMPAWTDYEEWDKFPTQKSAPVTLVAGTRYYVEAVFKEDIAEDHLAVGWLKPGESGELPSEIIPGQHLSPIAP